MGQVKPTLIIEDCSALGQISTVAAVTILQSLGETTALLPTSLLSTQTEGFGRPVQLATADWLLKTSHHWQDQRVEFKSALVGYLGSPHIIATVHQLLDQLRPPRLIVDPVMADQGQLYPGLTSHYPRLLRSLCRRATVITPNWTELCLLAGQPVAPSREHLTELMDRLSKMKITAPVVVTGVRNGPVIGYWLVEHQHVVYLPEKYFPGHYYGTGDTFAALLTGFLNRQFGLEQAITAAGAALTTAVAETSQLPEEERYYGLRLQALLADLARKG